MSTPSLAPISAAIVSFWLGVRGGRSGGGLLARVATGGLLCRHLRRISRRLRRRCFSFGLLGLGPCKLQHLGDGMAIWDASSWHGSAAETLPPVARPRRRQNRRDQEPDPTCQVPNPHPKEQNPQTLKSQICKATAAPEAPGRPAPRRLRLSDSGRVPSPPPPLLPLRPAFAKAQHSAVCTVCDKEAPICLDHEACSSSRACGNR